MSFRDDLTTFTVAASVALLSACAQTLPLPVARYRDGRWT